MYDILISTKNDINEHLSPLSSFASQCEHITEIWVRTWVSSYAILNWMWPWSKFVSYDININKEIEDIKHLTKIEWKDRTFIKWDTRDINIAVIEEDTRRDDIRFYYIKK